MSAETFNIVDLFYHTARKIPGKKAIIDRDACTITFGELQHQVESAAQFFLHKGIGKGDRVLVFIPMGVDLYLSVLALFRIGAIAVFLDEWVGLRRLRKCCRIADCKAFIAGWKVMTIGWFIPEIRKIPIKTSPPYKAISMTTSYPLTQKNDTALITFTTGSSGMPKAAKRTHGFLWEQFKVLQNIIDPKPDDVNMPVLPIVLLINLATGTPSVIADYKSHKPQSLKPARIMEQIKEHRVNGLIASPYLVKELAKYLIQTNGHLPDLRKIFTGGAPVFPEDASILLQAFPRADIEILYGSTEAEPIASVGGEKLAAQPDVSKGLWVGKVDSSACVKIIPIHDVPLKIENDTELLEYELADCEIGEIIVSGSHVLREYFNNTQALARQKIFVGDQCWHRTGDSGFKDGDQLYLTGPCHSMIREQGYWLSPFIFEHHLQSQAGVAAGTLMMWQGKRTAVLETEGKAKQREIAQQVKQHPDIDEVIFINKLPRDPRHFSKIDYKKLKIMLS